MLIQAKEFFRFWPITDGCFKVQEFLLRQRNPRYLSGGIASYTQAKGSVASRQGVAFGHVRRHADVLKRLRQQSFEGTVASLRASGLSSMGNRRRHISFTAIT
jgi:hypothetical protein